MIRAGSSACWWRRRSRDHRTFPACSPSRRPLFDSSPGFGDSSLNFTLICQVKEFVDQYLVQHELRKRIFNRFKEEGIEIPFPIRTVYLKKTHESEPTLEESA